MDFSRKCSEFQVSQVRFVLEVHMKESKAASQSEIGKNARVIRFPKVRNPKSKIWQYSFGSYGAQEKSNGKPHPFQSSNVIVRNERWQSKRAWAIFHEEII
jgi:hypothetical protein